MKLKCPQNASQAGEAVEAQDAEAHTAQADTDTGLEAMPSSMSLDAALDASRVSKRLIIVARENTSYGFTLAYSPSPLSNLAVQTVSQPRHRLQPGDRVLTIHGNDMRHQTLPAAQRLLDGLSFPEIRVAVVPASELVASDVADVPSALMPVGSPTREALPPVSLATATPQTTKQVAGRPPLPKRVVVGTSMTTPMDDDSDDDNIISAVSPDRPQPADADDLGAISDSDHSIAALESPPRKAGAGRVLVMASRSLGQDDDDIDISSIASEDEQPAPGAGPANVGSANAAVSVMAPNVADPTTSQARELSPPQSLLPRAVRLLRDTGTQSPALSIASAADPTASLPHTEYSRVLSWLAGNVIAEDRTLLDLDLLYGMAFAPSIIRRLIDPLSRRELPQSPIGLRECGAAIVQLIRHYPGGLLPPAFVSTQLTEHSHAPEAALLEALGPEQREFWLVAMDHFATALARRCTPAADGQEDELTEIAPKKRRAFSFSKKKNAPAADTSSLRSTATQREPQPLGVHARALGGIVGSALVAESVEASAYATCYEVRTAARLQRVRLCTDIQELLQQIAEDGMQPASAGHLRQLLLGSDGELLLAILQCRAPGTHLEESLVQVFASGKKLLDLFAFCVRHEVDGTVEDHGLMRSNTRAMRIISTCMKLLSREYLPAILSTVVVEIAKAPQEYELSGPYYEASVKHKRRAERNVASAVQTILNNLASTPVPPLMRLALSEVRCCVATAFPTQERNALKTVLLLRLLMPALVGPVECGVVTGIAADAVGSLVGVSRVLQTVANGTAPVAGLACFADLVAANQPSLAAALDSASLPASSDAVLHAETAQMAQMAENDLGSADSHICEYLKGQVVFISDWLIRPAAVPESADDDIGVRAFGTFVADSLVRRVRAAVGQPVHAAELMSVQKVC